VSTINGAKQRPAPASMTKKLVPMTARSSHSASACGTATLLPLSARSARYSRSTACAVASSCAADGQRANQHSSGAHLARRLLAQHVLGGRRGEQKRRV
jgi:hypothetical protein